MIPRVGVVGLWMGRSIDLLFELIVQIGARIMKACCLDYREQGEEALFRGCSIILNYIGNLLGGLSTHDRTSHGVC